MSAAATVAARDVQSAPADRSPESVLDRVFTSVQASRGERQYEQACLSCHATREFTGRRFAAKWPDLTLGDLFDQISATMPEGAAGTLEPGEYASILAFLLRESGYPDGQTDLPANSEALRKLRIEPLPK